MARCELTSQLPVEAFRREHGPAAFEGALTPTIENWGQDCCYSLAWLSRLVVRFISIAS